MNYEEAKKKVQQYGQEHVLRYYEELDKADQEELLKQIEETDMSVLSLCTHKEDLPEKGVITPLAAMQLDEIEAEKETYRNAGTKSRPRRKSRGSASCRWHGNKTWFG